MKTYEVRQKYQYLDQDEPSMDVRIRGGMDYDEARMYVNIVIEEDFQVPVTNTRENVNSNARRG